MFLCPLSFKQTTDQPIHHFMEENNSRAELLQNNCNIVICTIVSEKQPNDVRMLAAAAAAARSNTRTR